MIILETDCSAINNACCCTLTFLYISDKVFNILIIARHQLYVYIVVQYRIYIPGKAIDNQEFYSNNVQQNSDVYIYLIMHEIQSVRWCHIR